MALIMDIENVVLVDPGDKLGHMLILLKDALVARGWVVQGSGDGQSAFENTGQTAGPYNVFTTAPGYANVSFTWNGAQANKISKPLAWLRLKEPSPSTREILFQRSSTTSASGIYGLVAVIAPAGFTGNNASATSAPTGTSYPMDGALTSTNVPGSTGVTYPNSNWSGITTETKRFYALISDAALAGNVWPFYAITYDATDATRDSGFIYDGVTGGDANDPEPWVSNYGVFTNVFNIPANNAAPVFAGLIAGAVTNIQSGNMSFAAGSFPGSGVHNNGGDSQTRAFRTHLMEYFVVGGLASASRYKGRLVNAHTHYSSRNYPDTLDLTTATPSIYLGRYLMPWKQNSTPGT